MIYKRENQIGNTTAVRRMSIELESLVMTIIVIQSGGEFELLLTFILSFP